MNDNTMHILPSQEDAEMARRLLHDLSAMRGGSGGVSKATQSNAGSAPTGTDAPGIAGQGSDSDGNQGTGVKS